MVSTALQFPSHAVSTPAAQPVAPENGADRSQLLAARAELDPAVVNHVGRAGAADGKAATSDGQASPEQAADSAKTDDAAETDEVRRLKARDSEVRAHERAHAAAGGALAGAPSFTFERGPDGRSYAVSGEVSIDVSDVSNDAQATVRKMQQVKRAALAPQSPSDADRAIAAMADSRIAAARVELSVTGSEETPEEQASTQAANAAIAGAAARTEFGSYEHRKAAAAAYHAAAVPASGNGINVAA
jgi:hypothetical protein